MVEYYESPVTSRLISTYYDTHRNIFDTIEFKLDAGLYFSSESAVDELKDRFRDIIDDGLWVTIHEDLEMRYVRSYRAPTIDLEKIKSLDSNELSKLRCMGRKRIDEVLSKLRECT